MSHYIRKCLSTLCHNVFVTKDPFKRCPQCGNAPSGSVRRGDEVQWTLKEAKRIAAMMRKNAA